MKNIGASNILAAYIYGEPTAGVCTAVVGNRTYGILIIELCYVGDPKIKEPGGV